MKIDVIQTVDVSKTPFCKNCLRLNRFDIKDKNGRCVPRCELFGKRVFIAEGEYLKCKECYDALYENLETR